VCVTASAKAVPWLRRLVAVLTPQRPVHKELVVDKVALGQGIFRVLRFPPVNIIPLEPG
jgi:hypothetical protein